MNGDPSSRRWSGRPWQPPAARRDEWFLLCPVLFFAVYFVFVFNAELGIRYALVVFPLIHVFCGSLLAGPRPLARRGRAGVGILAASIVVSGLSHLARPWSSAATGCSRRRSEPSDPSA